MTRILFIGNSYTFYNQLWDVFAEIARGEGHPVSVDEVTKGGYRLAQMNDPSNEYGAQIAQKLSNHSYDIVFLQEQSLNPILNSKQFNTSVRALSEKIRAIGAKPVLYETWGRKTGHEALEQNGWTTETMTSLLASAYHKIGKECDVEVSPVGEAFYEVYSKHPEIELYHADMTHPSPAGTYLAALCHYATVFQKSPIGVTYIFGVEALEHAAILQAVAHKAVFGEG